MMKSGKQRRAELEAKRKSRERKAQAKILAEKTRQGVDVDKGVFTNKSSYTTAKLLQRGYYVDIDFVCEGCGSEETWTARQQKWWYEVARGSQYSSAKLCRACRRQARERREQARRKTAEGLARKKLPRKS